MRDFAAGGNTFALEVRGDSMIDDHICDGDLILLERVPEVRDGDIVVALVAGHETTLKRLYRESGDTIRLQPANSAMKPILVPARDVQVQGRCWPCFESISESRAVAMGTRTTPAAA